MYHILSLCKLDSTLSTFSPEYFAILELPGHYHRIVLKCNFPLGYIADTEDLSHVVPHKAAVVQSHFD